MTPALSRRRKAGGGRGQSGHSPVSQRRAAEIVREWSDRITSIPEGYHLLSSSEHVELKTSWPLIEDVLRSHHYRRLIWRSWLEQPGNVRCLQMSWPAPRNVGYNYNLRWDEWT